MNFRAILLTLLNMHGILTNLKDESLIETTCRNTPNYQLCIATLQANPKSATADMEGLGLIMVEAIKKKTETALSAINEVQGTRLEMADALDSCRNVYRAVLIADIPEAVAGLTKGVPKFAEKGMSDVAWEADICEEGFESVEGFKALRTVNKDVHDLAEVATHIIKNLL